MRPVNWVSIDWNSDLALAIAEIDWSVISMSVVLKRRYMTKLKYMYFKSI